MKEELKKDIGKRMRKIRNSLGFTQDKMASYFDIGRANYSRIEKGEIFPKSTLLHILKREFNISLDWLIAEEGDMTMEDNGGGRNDIWGNGDYPEEIRDLLYHMDNVPIVRHNVLGFFLEYKEKNRDLIHQQLEENHTNDKRRVIIG